MNRKNSYTLLKGFSVIEDFVEEEGYSPFEEASLKHIHRAYILADNQIENIETELKNIGEEDKESSFLNANPKYFSRMKKIFEDRILSKYFDKMSIFHYHIPGKADYFLDPIENISVIVEGCSTSIAHYNKDNNIFSFGCKELNFNYNSWKKITDSAKKDDYDNIKKLLKDYL